VGSGKKEHADYNGWEAFKKPKKTIVRGNTVFDNGEIADSPGYRKIIKVGIRTK